MEGEQKIPYPKSIPFILTTEFCERFSYYGMRGGKEPHFSSQFNL